MILGLREHEMRSNPCIIGGKGRNMKVLILSCNTGEGHNAAGKAVKECLERRGHQADMVDMMLLKGKRTSKVIGGAYVELVKHAPRIFGLVYKAGEAIRSAKRKSPVYQANKLLAKSLKDYLDQENYDVIATPHLYPAETLTYMKKKGWLKQKVVAIGTDYTCIPFWEETACDYYVIPHKEAVEEWVSYGLPREKLCPLGIPVKPEFAVEANQEKARSVCGLPADKPAYLVMSGSMGFGKIHIFAQELSRRCKDGEQIIIICGNNRRRKYAMKLQFFKNPDVHVLGYTSHVAVYMEACDVIFTKPGGLSSTEAAVKQIPIVHTAPIPGCETKNVEFFTSHGMSIGEKTIEKQIRAGQFLMRDENARAKMKKAQRENTNPRSGYEIVTLLEKLCQNVSGNS